jgi:hypothetical protein
LVAEPQYATIDESGALLFCSMTNAQDAADGDERGEQQCSQTGTSTVDTRFANSSRWRVHMSDICKQIATMTTRCQFEKPGSQNDLMPKSVIR